MPDSTPRNSSVNIGTSGAFTRVNGQHNVACRCCNEHQDYSSPLWEFRNGDWLCTPCAELAKVLLEAGQDRSCLVFGYLVNPMVVKNGFDL